jgi:hypothetical protein
MKIFLKIKHWQFLLAIGLVIVCANMNPLVESAMFALTYFILFNWYFAISKFGLNLGYGLKLFKLKKWVLSFLYVCMSIALLDSRVSGGYLNQIVSELYSNQFMSAILLIIAIIGAISYPLLIINSAIIVFRMDQSNSKTSIFGNFMLLTLFPIGIWTFQPQINKWFKIDCSATQ